LPFPFQVVLLEAVISGVGYAGATWVLLKSRWRIAPRIETVRDLLTLIITTSLATMLVAVATIAVLSSAGLMRPERAIPAFWRFWIGDIIGILVVLPFLLKVAADGNGPRVTSEPLAQLLAILGTIAIMFASPSGLRLPISYILFLPIVWIAVRGGLARVASGLVIMQIALMIAIHITADDPANIASYQALMVALSVSGLTIGVLTDERVRGERDLRRQQDAIARAARIGTLGEMATAVAHELNQPLTAAANYAR
ncbi:MAG TPA: MASE1 domain-containing protein, partial [Hyphomicrobiaceae bacterium]|nr:MASE1 domain-containing protein [Hyphomicrobiaceae bacterium]